MFVIIRVSIYFLEGGAVTTVPPLYLNHALLCPPIPIAPFMPRYGPPRRATLTNVKTHTRLLAVGTFFLLMPRADMFRFAAV